MAPRLLGRPCVCVHIIQLLFSLVWTEAGAEGIVPRDGSGKGGTDEDDNQSPEKQPIESRPGARGTGRGSGRVLEGLSEINCSSTYGMRPSSAKAVEVRQLTPGTMTEHVRMHTICPYSSQPAQDMILDARR